MGPGNFAWGPFFYFRCVVVAKKIRVLKDFMLKITPDIIYHLSQDQVLTVSFLSETQFSQYLQISNNFVEAGSEEMDVKEILVLDPTLETVPTDDTYDGIPECDLECNVKEVIARNRK